MIIVIVICENHRSVKFNSRSSKVCERMCFTFLLKCNIIKLLKSFNKRLNIVCERNNYVLKIYDIKIKLTRVITSETIFLRDCIKICTERTFAVIKWFCFCVLPFLCSILHWTNVPKWKWIPAHKTDDVKALEWNSHQESTIWCIGLPLAEESINIRALHSVVSKAWLYRVVPVSSSNIVTS